MKRSLTMALVPALALLAACGRKDDTALDDSLRNDLALASSVQPYQQQQFVSPMEQGMANGTPRTYGTGTYAAPAPRRTTVRRTSAPASTYPSTSRSPAEPVRHTKRDAIIGASAGAVIGATTSRDKVKGGLIGAAIGGIAGAVVGHTVDVERP